MLKRGAMFGLDARIALAIFGALSVISGAALYNAIQEARAVSILTEMKEVGKAWEQFYLDTGTEFVPYDTDNTKANYHLAKISSLTTDYSIKGWKGPYLSYDGTDEYRLKHPSYAYVYNMRMSTNDAWKNWSTAYCSTGKACSIWVAFNGIESESTVKRIDEIVDGSISDVTGSVRWRDTTNPILKYEIYLNISPVSNPHD